MSVTLAFAASTGSLGIFEKKELNHAPATTEHVPDEILVKFKPGAREDAINKINSDYRTSDKSTLLSGTKVLKISSNKTVEEMVEAYSSLPEVEYAEPNYIAHAFMVPDDPLYSYQWHLDNDVYGGIHMEPAWDISTGSGVVVAVLDTGVAYENYGIYCQAPDLAGTTFVSGYDFVNGDAHPNDDEGHGTHVAGTVAQTTNNYYGVAGVAFDCSIMPVKVLNETGYGAYSGIANGIYYATDNGADVISMSLGGPTPSPTLEDAVAYAYNNGVTVVAAVGNEYQHGNPPQYPAAYDDYIIAVGATRYDEIRSYYSNTGSYLDLTAPGGDITVDQNSDGYGDGVLQQTFSGGDPCDFGLWFFQGTSMATPHVSGVAALLIANGVTGPDNVRNRLESTAEDKGTPGWDEEYGWGIVDAYAALLPDLPFTIRVYRTGTGELDIEPFKYYTKGVLPSEWIASWPAESLKAGAVAIKTYAWNWTDQGSHGHNNERAHVCDGPHCQAYEKQPRTAATDNAVEDTWLAGMTKHGEIFESQYWDGRAVVDTGGSRLRIREEPGTSSEIIGYSDDGDELCVLSNGLKEKDGYYWFFIKTGGITEWNPASYITGWVAGGSVDGVDEYVFSYWSGQCIVKYRDRMTQWGSKYWANQGENFQWILRYFYSYVYPDFDPGIKFEFFDITPPSPKFNIGDRVQATADPCLRVRTEAWINNDNPTDNVIWCAPKGSTGTVVYDDPEPQSSHSYIWWKIEYDAGYTGWSAQDWLEKISEECEGTDTSCGIYPNCENCNDYDGCYAYGNGCEERNYYCYSNEVGCEYTYSNRHTDYYDDWEYYCKGDEVWKHRLFHDFSCDGGSCTDHTSWVDDQLVENCNDYDGWYCNGDIREYRDYYCSGGSCTYTATSSENCNDYDGCYAYGDGCEDRDYYCSGGSCDYTYSNRHTDYYDDWEYYCKGDEVWKHRQFHDFYCEAGNCTDHTSWANETFVENCGDSDGWVDTGNTRWIEDPGNECKEKEQKEQEYHDYTCSGGSCDYCVTDTRWIDTGNTRNKDDGTICGCTANNTLKRCYVGICSDTGICNSTMCGADADCDGKKPGESCDTNKKCNSNCKCQSPEVIFNTEQPKNPYPSIFGTHNGTITPNQTITVSKMYTYPCQGTGGHSASVAFYNSTTKEEIANGTWNGYQGAGDYHHIEFDVPFTLQENETYNYTIRTGSCPQIFHNKTLATANGWINCTKFTDANGKEYTDWIPAIRLE